MTLGGEVIVLDIDGRSSAGYYVQGSYDLSALAPGLRLLAKYDLLRDGSGERDALFRRWTLGLRYALRRDLDLDLEFDQDRGSHRVRGFGGSHLIVGLRYRF